MSTTTMNPSRINTTNQAQASVDFSKLSKDELQQKMGEAFGKGDINLVNQYLDAWNKLNATGGNKDELTTIRDQITNLISGNKRLTKTDLETLRKLRENELSLFNHKETSNTSKQQHKYNIKNVMMDDLMKQLDQKDNELVQQKDDYNKLLMADEKLIGPQELVRRGRLRGILSKMKEKKDPTEKIKYFLCKTSFFLGGKVTAAWKRAALTLSTLSKMSFTGMGQLNHIRDEVKKACKEMEPDENKDSITVQLLRKDIIKEATSCIEGIEKSTFQSFQGFSQN